MKKLHQAWLILGITAFTLLACLGLGRFALGAMIPFMKEGLHLSYKETGWVASAVFVGYLVMVTVAGYLVRRFTAKKVIVISLLVISLGMLGNANASNFWTAYLSSLLMGLGAGGANIPALGLLAGWFAPHKRGMAMGVAYCGTGLGFVFSGLLIPSMVGLEPTNGWRLSWYILALSIFVIALIHQLFLRNTPQEVGLQPLGSDEVQTADMKLLENKLEPAKKNTGKKTEAIYGQRILWIIGGIYFTWGFSYIIFSTFLVDFLIEEVGFEKSKAGQYFSIVGLFSVISGFIWGSISDRLGRPLTLALVYTVQSLVLLALAFTVHPLLILLEIIFFAVTLWAVPSIMAAIVGDYISIRYIASAMGFITLFFGVGQFLSPIVTGYLLESQGSYVLAFTFSALICFAGGLGNVWLHLKQKEVKQSHSLSSSISE